MKCVQLCFRIVQSYFLSDGYSHQPLFIEHTLRLVRAAISNAEVFFVGSDFNVWKVLSDPSVDSFIEAFCCLYSEFLAKRRRLSDEHDSECNRVNRLSSAEQGSKTSSVVRSSSSSSVGKAKEEASKTVEKAVSAKRAGKPKKPERQASSSKSTTPKKKLKKVDGPPVYHHVK